MKQRFTWATLLLVVFAIAVCAFKKDYFNLIMFDVVFVNIAMWLWLENK